MNAHHDTQFDEFEKAALSPEDELLVERLVDGELSDVERENLFYRLDEKFDGWRFCALSFLEAQSFRVALKNLSDTNEIKITENEYPQPKTSNGRVLGTSVKAWFNCSLSAVAGFLLATVAIFSVVDFGATPSSSDLVITSESKRNNLEGSPLMASQESVNAPPPRQASVTTRQDSSKSSSLFADSVVPKTIVLNNPSQGLSNVITTYEEVTEYDPLSIQASNSTIPQEVVNHMYNVGGSVDAHRDEYRFPLDNGRILILPVDTYNVKTNENQRIW